MGLEDVSKYPALFVSLLASGSWSVDDLKKLAGLNFLRVFKEVEKVRKRDPFYMLIAFSVFFFWSILLPEILELNRYFCLA